jgi:hypothetical protein
MSDDDDKTRIRRPPSPSPAPARSPGDVLTQVVAAPNALTPGFELREFEIERVIGEGGFSIVYLAIDKQLVRRVAIKEYMPSSLAMRTQDLSIVAKSERFQDTFDAGLRSFVNEARLLAQFDHPSLVKVYRFWEERGTAYMVMPYYEGVTLTHWRRHHGDPDEAWLRRLLDALLQALAQLHGQNCYHRDVAPDNILLLPGDVPVLLDLGAARRIVGEMTQALTVILKPGYAPVEQYAEVAAMKQGAWTDLYALAAVMYFIIAGRSPPPAVARMVNDELRPAVEVGGGRYSHELLTAIDTALAVLPDKRPQDIAAFRQLLGAEGPIVGAAGTQVAVATTMPTSSPGIPGVTTVAPEATRVRPHAPTPPPGVAAPRRETLVTSTPHARTQPGESPPPRRWPLFAAAAVVLLALVAGGAWWLQSPPSGSVAKSDVRPGKADAPVKKDTVASLQNVSIHELLLRLLDARSPKIEVRAASNAASMRIGKDELRFGVASSVPGYVYVLLAGTDESHLWLLFPNASDNNNQIAANTTLLLPRSNWRIFSAGPPGTNRVLVIVSPHPRDFSAAGLRLGEPFSEFATSALRASIARDGIAVLAGRAVCADAANCEPGFGAATFEVLEVAESK